jgi:hypothetical protein
MSPRVVRVEALSNSCLRLFFDNGEVRLFNVSPYLDKGTSNNRLGKSYNEIG